MEYFIKLYKKKTGKDIRKDHRAVQKLRREVEKAKRALSVQHQVRVEVESLFDGEDFSETLTRAKFEELNMVSNQMIVTLKNQQFFRICSAAHWSQFKRFWKMLTWRRKKFTRSSWSVVQLVFQRFNNCSRNSSTEKSHHAESIQMKPLPMVLQFKYYNSLVTLYNLNIFRVELSPAKKTLKSSCSMSIHWLWVLKLLEEVYFIVIK